MCLVSASLREKVFSSRHIGQRTFCLRLLCIVSSWRVRSYGREKIVLHGLPVDGLIRVHLCGPAWEFLARIAAEVMPLVEGSGEPDDRGDAEAVPDADADAPLSCCFCCERW